MTILWIIKNIIFILFGLHLIDTKRSNYFSQFFWGFVGAVTLLGNTLDLLKNLGVIK